MARKVRPRFFGEGKHRKGTGALEWRIEGPATVIGQPGCPIHPEFFYEVLISKQTNAEIQHIIWSKKPPSGTTAIERVLIDNEGDYAVNKTPHHCDLAGRVSIMSFCSYGVYDLQVSVIWLDTSNSDRHMNTQSLKITSKPKGP